MRDILVPGMGWELVADGYGDARAPANNSKGEVFFLDVRDNTIRRIGLDGKVTLYSRDAGHADGLCVGPKDEIYTVSRATGKIVCYDGAGRRRSWATGIPGQYAVTTADGGLYVSGPGAAPADGSRIWLVKGGRKRVVDSALKRATGLAIRPDRWLLSAADGASKWVTSCRIAPDGSLADKERYFWLHVADADDDAGAESVCYSREGRMLVATRLGIQVSADDGPTQAILPVPDHARVVGVCLGGPAQDTLYAFCGAKVWRRVVKVHAIGAFSPWTQVNGTPL